MKIITILFILIASLSIKAQSSIRLMDLSIMPVPSLESNTNGVQDYQFYFKIDKPENAAQIILKLGSTQGLSDVKQITASVSHNGGSHVINYEGKQYSIRWIEASFTISLTPQELTNANVYTLYIVDNQGLETIRYYLNN